MRFVRFAWMLFVLLLALPVQAQPVADAYLVTPGKGIGTIAIGQSLDEVQAQIGTALRSVTDSRGNIIYAWFPDGQSGIAVGVNRRHVVTAVLAYKDPRYHTAAGITSGLSESRVRDTLGSPGHVITLPEGRRSLRYPGLNVLVDSTKTVYELSVVAIQP